MIVEIPKHIEQSRPSGGKVGGAAENNGSLRHWRSLKITLLAVIALFALLAVFSGLIEKGLWMQQVGYYRVFWTVLSLRLELFFAAFAVALLYLWTNLYIAAKNGSTFRAGNSIVASTMAAKFGIQISASVLKIGMAAVAAVAALFFGLMLSGQWDTFLRFRYGGSFGLSDPLFRVDAGFYILRLPFYELLQNSVAILAFIAMIGVLFIYGYLGLLQFGRSAKVQIGNAEAGSHLSILSAVLVASWGWGFYLDHFQLLYSTQGVVYGAGYTADHVTRVAYWIMAGAAAVLCALLVSNIFRARFKAIVFGCGMYLGLYLIGVLLLPVLFQRFMVQPNELALETPYLKNNIEFTRKAFQLDTIQETAYPALSDLITSAAAAPAISPRALHLPRNHLPRRA